MTSSPSRYSLPKPEDGLEEWTSKIKAMQKQVDADEEDEQRKLEEEIAASRLARIRRSQMGYHPRHGGGGTIASDNNTHATAVRDDEPTRAVGEPHVQQEIPNQQRKVPSSSFQLGSNRPEPMSLAAFIGGRATGPRLNKHAPQQDAHDPTQFQQKTSVTTPHPVFGSGGVAMHGMVKSKSIDPSDMNLQTPKTGSAAAQYSSTGTSSDRSPSPSKSRSRERATGPSRIPDFETEATEQDPPSSSMTSVSKPTSPPWKQSRYSPVASPVKSSTSSTTPPHKSPVLPSSFAKPIQPTPRHVSLVSNTSPSQSTSPAFLKAPVQKDLTPSLSRLQGRGFVQSIVQVSKELQSASSAPVTPEKHPVKKLSILDRWPEGKVPSSPPTVTEAVSARRPTRDVYPESSQADRQNVHAAMAQKLKTEKSADKMIFPQHTPGLGSATTMVLFKPDADSQRPSLSDVDELGVQRSANRASRQTPSKRSELPSGKPLVHPTKDRARRPPKKHSSVNPATSSPSPVLKTSKTDQDPLHVSPFEVHSVKTSPSMDIQTTHTHEPKSRSSEESTTRLHGGSEGRQRSPESRDCTPLLGMETTVSTGQALFSQVQVEPLERSQVSVPVSELETQNNVRHTRIPSTGNRATVMDVAQLLSEQTSITPVNPVDTVSKSSNIPIPRQNANVAERRKSSYERYSMVLPPLQEESSPVQSPAGTLTRNIGISSVLVNPRVEEAVQSTASVPQDELYFEFTDDPLPDFDLKCLETKGTNVVTRNGISALTTLSVEVMVIGSGNNAIVSEQNIFHDDEVIAVIHRSKAKQTGLVTTAVWGWKGRKTPAREDKQNRLHDLAKRYGTSLTLVEHFYEPPELVVVIGGILIIRQGSRTHWSSENTSMHCVRDSGGVIIIDEVDPTARNLCSGFSYCITILGNVYVWHGRGSAPHERVAAQAYGQSLGDNLVEMQEGENDIDDMFWMVLGDEQYANADYWKWRSKMFNIEPKIYFIGLSNGTVKTSRTMSFNNLPESVLLLDCIWELFVLVGRHARSKRQEIRLALQMATRLASERAPLRPFKPPVHVVIQPSMLPLDMRMHFRDAENVLVDHMNVVSAESGWEQLQRRSWPSDALKDSSMLPLGVSF